MQAADRSQKANGGETENLGSALYFPGRCAALWLRLWNRKPELPGKCVPKPELGNKGNREWIGNEA